MTPERIEEFKHYFTDEQLDEMSREYRTMPTDGEGYAIEPEYEGMVARGNIVKLVSDVKTARAALEESQQRIGKVELYVKSLEFNREDTQKRANEKLRERDTNLVEAQQTIARQREAFEKISKLTASNPTDLYWRGADAIEIARKELGNKEGSDKA